MEFLLVFFGGGVGACLRHFVSLLIKTSYPIPTLFVNVLGSFLIGLLSALFLKYNLENKYQLFFVKGLLGGFTTFSSFSLDFVNLAQKNNLTAIIYLFLNISLSIVFCFLAIFLVKKFNT